MANATQNQTTDDNASTPLDAETDNAGAPEAPEAPEAPAKDPKDDEAPAGAPAENPAPDQPQDKADPKPKAERKQGEARRKANAHALEACLDEHGQVREDTESYADLGPVYAAATPVANAWGAELGFVTKDEKAGTVQRTGFGFYLRSDHLCNKKYDLTKIDLTKLP